MEGYQDPLLVIKKLIENSCSANDPFASDDGYKDPMVVIQQLIDNSCSANDPFASDDGRSDDLNKGMILFYQEEPDLD